MALLNDDELENVNGGVGANSRYHSYKIKSGDTLFELSKRFNVPMKVLQRLNNIEDADKIKVDRVIIVPKF